MISSEISRTNALLQQPCKKRMCVINYSDTEKDILIMNNLLTVWAAISHWHWKPLQRTDNVRVQISRRLSVFVAHRQLNRPISLIFWASLSHWQCAKVYLTSYGDSPTGCVTRIKQSDIRLWQHDSLTTPHWFSGPRSFLSVGYRQFTFPGKPAKLHSYRTSI